MGQWRHLRSRLPWLAVGIEVALGVALSLAVLGAWLVAGALSGLPADAAIRHIGDMDQATTVYDQQDRLAFTIFKEQRIDVPLSQVSPYLVRAIVAVEDQRFYEHRGFDAVRIVSAAVTDIRHRRAAQGGSTITQQLARQSFLTPNKTIRRKLQELILADRIEHMYSKPRILELYLNKVYFGDGLYGVEAAARGYFGRHASELSLSEAALLAGIVKSPAAYAPTVNLERAVARRNVVLQAMLDTRAIDRPAWESARTATVTLHDELRAQEPHGQYFEEQVRRELAERFGSEQLYGGGLRVHTTIDMRMQVAAESAVTSWLHQLDARRRALAARRRAAPPQGSGTGVPGELPLQAALIAMDPATGEVRAMVGGRDFNESRFNRALQAHRQPGSAFKPFVYAAALEAGYTPATVIDHLDDPIPTLQGAWAPEDEHSTAPSMTMRTALRTSSNRAAVQMLQQVGVERTVQYAQATGLGDLPSVPSLALGSGEVTLQAMTAAYAAFANHGLAPRPVFIRRVEDRTGRVLFDADESTPRVMSEATAFLMSTMLADVIDAGTAAGARRLGFTLPAAGKTGTTNDFHDAWFIGYTPTLAAGVWVGFDQPRTILPNGFAADIAVPLWTSFMKDATRGDPPTWLPVPPGVTNARVCRLSGKLASDGCEDVYTEYFARGTEPTAYCDLHPTPGLLGKLARVLGMAGGAPLSDQPEPTKKRGLLSKVFGLGKNDDGRK